MSQIILGQTNDVPKGVLLEQNKLILKKGKIFEETITVKLLDRVTTNLHVVSEESTQAKIIIDIEDYQATNSSYKIHLDVHQNSNLKFLFIANIHNAPSEIEFTSQSLNDSNVEFIGGFVSDKVNVKLHLDLHGKGANLKVRTIAVSSKDHEQNLDVKM